ncbi:hypothetical protein [Streptomyces yanii]
MAVDPRNTYRRCPQRGHTPRRIGPAGTSSTASRAATTHTRTQWAP